MTGMSWNERPQKVEKINFILLFYTQNYLADQKRTEGKKAVGSDDSDDDRPKKKSGKANGKSKKR
jgi:hypothetical protein